MKVKDLVKNVTDLTEALRSSIPLSDGAVSSILEAGLSRSQVQVLLRLFRSPGRPSPLGAAGRVPIPSQGWGWGRCANDTTGGRKGMGQGPRKQRVSLSDAKILGSL